MKLYTENDLLNAIAFGYHYCNKENIPSDNIINNFIEQLTPIELPSDEEIENEGKLVFNEKGKTIYTHYNTVPSWSDGAKWMRDKIQGGNNEQ